ncbi:hypothetical protein [Pseudomonas laurylsulfatiphila]|uniref:hypothetical protein n=1 Tax=Pseudomonas laurylsulfatiphila TaxID=2011015 RepID=UPI003D1D2E17
MNVQDVADAIAKNVKTGKWLSCTFTINHPNDPERTISVGVKAYGKWVQRLECCGCVEGIPEQPTQKALKEKVVSLIDAAISVYG